jgi:hypothetical protein
MDAEGPLQIQTDDGLSYAQANGVAESGWLSRYVNPHSKAGIWGNACPGPPYLIQGRVTVADANRVVLTSARWPGSRPIGAKKIVTIQFAERFSGL